jgi:hypothetical protein
MEFTAKPEVLPLRTKRGGKVFDDENLDLLSHILDDFLRIPGTSIRFGLDGIVGLIPGVGDLVGGIASCVIIFAAWARGVPYVTVIRMVANVGIEVVVGSIPVLGDMFDIAWRANRRNYALLAGSLAEPRRNKIQSWIFLTALLVLLTALVLIPMLFLAWLTDLVLRRIGMDLHRLFGM